MFQKARLREGYGDLEGWKAFAHLLIRIFAHFCDSNILVISSTTMLLSTCSFTGEFRSPQENGYAQIHREAAARVEQGKTVTAQGLEFDVPVLRAALAKWEDGVLC